MPKDPTFHAKQRGNISAEDREAFRTRASDISQKLEQISRHKTPDKTQHDADRSAAMGQAFKISVELLAGLVFGFIVGWYLDQYFETSGPWFLIGFVVLGFAAGMSNVIRTAKRLQAKAEPLQRSAPSVKDDDEEEQ